MHFFTAPITVLCIFFSYCIVLPLTILVADVDIPKGGAVSVPCIITAINVAFATRRSLNLVVVWVLFECVMSFHLTKAIFTGLLGTKSANEWLVTEKHEDSAIPKIHSAPKRSLYEVIRSRIVLSEVGFGMFLFMSGIYGFLDRNDYYFIFLLIQAFMFTIVGFRFVGKILP